MSLRDLQAPGEVQRVLGELEALLFFAGRPLASALIARRVHLDENQVIGLLGRLQEDLNSPSRGLQLREAGGKWRLETKPEFEDVIASVRAERGVKMLTDQALESLAVIALKQPVTTEEVTAIRGAESYGTIETLRRHKLIAKAGKSVEEGRAARWRTTPLFLDQFGLSDPAELYLEKRMEKIFGKGNADTIFENVSAS